MIEIDEGEIIELLQQKMARIVVDARARVAAHGIDEALECCAIMKILAGMDFVADVASCLVECVEDRQPATSQFLESSFDQTRRALRPRDR